MEGGEGGEGGSYRLGPLFIMSFPGLTPGQNKSKSRKHQADNFEGYVLFWGCPLNYQASVGPFNFN